MIKKCCQIINLQKECELCGCCRGIICYGCKDNCENFNCENSVCKECIYCKFCLEHFYQNKEIMNGEEKVNILENVKQNEEENKNRYKQFIINKLI